MIDLIVAIRAIQPSITLFSRIVQSSSVDVVMDKNYLSQRFMYFLFTGEFNHSVFIAYGMFEYYFYCHIIWCYSFFCLVFIIIFGQSGANSLTISKARLKLDDQKSILMNYRRLQTLINIYNSCLSGFIWPVFIVCTIGMHSMCIFICVKYYAEINMQTLAFLGGWALNFIGVHLVVYTIQGNVFQESVEYVRFIRVRFAGHVEKRSIRSMSPIGISVGGIFTIDRITSLVVLSIVSSVALNSLLMF
ncbi:unnamed protein product [Allacma fusca]|uniref:Uncharacterized protein n=1 Tax=Allacma fusca TaxID=39272 RepID=A0A8J2NR13_9HEXA|nr:unnamed protein product [Allacma fusca]